VAKIIEDTVEFYYGRNLVFLIQTRNKENELVKWIVVWRRPITTGHWFAEENSSLVVTSAYLFY
jgi:hypothetical protein